MRFQLLLILFSLVGSVVLADDNLDELKTIQKIELLGGKITRDEELQGSPVVGISFNESKRFNGR